MNHLDQHAAGQRHNYNLQWEYHKHNRLSNLIPLPTWHTALIMASGLQLMVTGCYQASKAGHVKQF